MLAESADAPWPQTTQGENATLDHEKTLIKLLARTG
jgi:hypothetical protein